MKRGAPLLLAATMTGVTGAHAGPINIALPPHAKAAAEFVGNTTPQKNGWGSPCTMSWAVPGAPATSYQGQTLAACFFTLSLKHAYPTYTDALIVSWWGSISPDSPLYFQRIIEEKRFGVIATVGDVEMGDIIVTKWPVGANAYDGHLMIVEHAPRLMSSPLSPVISGTDQYEVGILDSTSDPHGIDDSRTNVADPMSSDEGAGRGTIRLYVNQLGKIVGHAWSASSGSTWYDLSARAIVIGRFKPYLVPIPI